MAPRRDESSDSEDNDYEENEYNGYGIEEGRGRGGGGGGSDENYNRYNHGESLSHKSDTYDEVWDGDLQQLGFGEEDFYGRMTTLLVGRTTGRRIKRVILKYGTLHFVLGFILIILSGYEDYNFSYLSYFNTPTHGASVIVSNAMPARIFPPQRAALIGLLAIFLRYYCDVVLLPSL